MLVEKLTPFTRPYGLIDKNPFAAMLTTLEGIVHSFEYILSLPLVFHIIKCAEDRFPSLIPMCETM